MDREVADFLRFCRFERRLAELTCSAYERDLRACHAFLTLKDARAGSTGGDPRLPRWEAFALECKCVCLSWSSWRVRDQGWALARSSELP